jgi:hypothetical protein
MKFALILWSLLFISVGALSKEEPIAKEEGVEVDATRIKANKDLPKVLYVVPWKDMESNKNTDQKIVLNDFFGDLYDPVLVSKAAK